MSSHRPFRSPKSGWCFRPFQGLLLANPDKIRITRPIRGFRPEAERTVSGNIRHQAILMWQGQLVRRPVLPPSEHVESFPKGSKGLPPKSAL